MEKGPEISLLWDCYRATGLFEIGKHVFGQWKKYWWNFLSSEGIDYIVLKLQFSFLILGIAGFLELLVFFVIYV